MGKNNFSLINPAGGSRTSDILLPLVSIWGVADLTCYKLTSVISSSQTLALVTSMLWVRWDRNQSLRQPWDKENAGYKVLSFLSIPKKSPYKGFPSKLFCVRLLGEGNRDITNANFSYLFHWNPPLLYSLGTITSQIVSRTLLTEVFLLIYCH